MSGAFRFTSESGHSAVSLECPLWTNLRHRLPEMCPSSAEYLERSRRSALRQIFNWDKLFQWDWQFFEINKEFELRATPDDLRVRLLEDIARERYPYKVRRKWTGAETVRNVKLALH